MYNSNNKNDTDITKLKNGRVDILLKIGKILANTENYHWFYL